MLTKKRQHIDINKILINSHERIIMRQSQECKND